MKSLDNKEKQWLEAQDSVKNIHNFYLFLFGYVVMTAYLHYIDLRDGVYDWAYISLILMTFSLIWMIVITFRFPLKDRMILKQMNKKNLK